MWFLHPWCNHVEDGRVFLESVLESHLCGNVPLAKYQFMSWEPCLYYADMLFFPPPRPRKTLSYSYVNPPGVSIESCPQASSPFPG